jgi:hypothetical protein
MAAELGSTATAFSTRRRSARAPLAWRRARRSRAARTVRNERAGGRQKQGNAQRHARFLFNPNPPWKTTRVRLAVNRGIRCVSPIVPAWVDATYKTEAGGGSTAGLPVHSDVAQASVRWIGLHTPRGRPADEGRAHQ